MSRAFGMSRCEAATFRAHRYDEKEARMAMRVAIGFAVTALGGEPVRVAHQLTVEARPTMAPPSEVP